MEGMPRVPMLLPEPKIPANQYDDEFRLKIKEYILLHFQDDPSKYDNAISEIMNLKQKISSSYADVETACLLKRYYAQLLMMKNRFPMEEGDPIKVLFCWYDRAMDIAHSATYDDIGFELACVMYNIGAVHASIAVNEGRENEDSIKNAFMHYQYAAWPLQHLRDKLNASKYASVDFDKELLTFFVNVLLGQAQECLLEKSLIDHRSNLVVAKLAIHLRDRYQECFRHLENSNLCDYVSSQKYKNWILLSLAKTTLLLLAWLKNVRNIMSNNVELHKALAAHSTNLHLLSLPITELTSKLAGPAINAGSTKEGAALRRVLDKTREMQTQRVQLLQRFTEEMNNDNIAKKLLSERDTDHKEMFSTELKKHDETLKYLDANLNAQEKILSALTEANADFSDYRKKIKASLNTFYLKLLDRLSKLTLAVEGIETAFGAERQRREAEKRSLEEKMAALKRASEAREALADFSIGGVSGSRPQPAAAVPAGRPRFGDYKEFYLSKMAASSAASAGFPAPQPMVYQPPQPSPASVGGYPGAPTHHTHNYPPDHYTCGPPSPAPSSIPDSPAYFPHHRHDEGRRSSPAPHHLQYSHVPPMPPMSYAAQAAAQNPALSLPQHLQPAVQSLPSSVHQAPLMTAQGRYTPTNQMQSLGNHTQMSSSTQHQAPVPPPIYAPQHYQSNQGMQNMSTPAIATPIASVSVAAGAAQWNQVQQPGSAPPVPQPNLQHLPMQSVQPTQQHIIYSSTGMQQPHMSPAPHPATFSAAAQQTASNYMQQPVYHAAQQPGSVENPIVSSGSGINVQNQPGPLPQNGHGPPHAGSQHYAQQYSQPHAPSSVLPPHGGLVCSTSNTSGPYTHTLSNGQMSHNSAPPQQNVGGPENPAKNGIGMPSTQGFQTTAPGQQIQQQGPSPSPQAPQLGQPPVQFAPLPSVGASPWHVGVSSNVAPSPWHAGAPAVAMVPNTSPIPPVQQFQPNQMVYFLYYLPDKRIPMIFTYLYEMKYVQNSPQTYQSTQKAVSNVDLLDGIIDNANLPPAMIPQPKEYGKSRYLLRSSAPSSSVSAESITLSAIHRLPDTPVSLKTQPSIGNCCHACPIQPMARNPYITAITDLLRSSAPSSSVSAESITLSAIHRLPDTPVSLKTQSVNSDPVLATAATPVQSNQWQEIPTSQPSQATAQMPRPAAAVMPIQHQVFTAPSVERPIETPVTTASSVPQQTPRVLPLTDILDPTKFELGPGDKARLEKRQLHEHIRSGGDVPLPQLDPNDPLNSLDPFWKAKTPRVLPLTDILDPTKFELGPGDKARLEKRQLHEHIRSGGDVPLPQLDPNDPLNSLDPFWKAK
ncbi:BRO1-like domain protein [Ostertagia ostertagi]